MSLNKMALSIFIAFAALNPMAFAKAKANSVETYNLDVKSSTISWVGRKKLGSEHNGNITFKEGKVEVVKNEITSGSFSVDMSTISNLDLKDSPDNQTKLVSHLSSPDFFNVAKYPESTFKITKVEKKSDKLIIHGDLTMVGATHPVSFDTDVKVEKNKVSGAGKVIIDRTKWGLKYNSGNFFKDLAAEKVINNEFELNLSLVATK